MTILPRSLQTAHVAKESAAPDTLVVAALLHDMGHFAHASGLDPTRRGIDLLHEVRGAELLLSWFGPEAR